VNLPTGHHLRPIRGDDVEIDYLAVMGSREQLWRRYGDAWGWPPASLTKAEDRRDLERHEREISAHESFNYAALDDAETVVLGCVYRDPPGAEQTDTDVLVSWWVVGAEYGGALDKCLASFIPRWVVSAWPFIRPMYHL